MDEQININTSVEPAEVEKDIDPGSTKEPWLRVNRFKVLLGVIGILAICLLGTIDSLTKTEQELKQKTESLMWLAVQHQEARDERDFYAKIAEDVNYYKFIKTVYEGKDKDGFFETISIVYEESKRANISPWETMSIIHMESGFNPKAVSQIPTTINGQSATKPCAYGLMQINLNAWKKEKGLNLNNIFNKRLNIRTGLEIYKYYLGLANGDKFLALFYYNNGTAPRTPNHSYAPAVMASKFMKMSANYEPIEFDKAIGISH